MRKRGVKIGWGKLGLLLRDADYRFSIATREPQALEELEHAITEKVRIKSHGKKDAFLQTVNQTSREILRLAPEGDSRLIILELSRANQPEMGRSSDGEHPFISALRKLPPFRAQTVKEIAEQSKDFQNLVILLANSTDKRTLLNQWADNPPNGLSNAVASSWCWLACVAGDYGANKSTMLFFVRKGVQNGASENYWWARAGLMIGTETADSSAEALELWSRTDPKHPIAEAGEALIQEDFKRAERVLHNWKPHSSEDKSIQILLLTATVTGQKEYNRAITIGKTAVEEYKDDSENALRTAEALLARGYYGTSDHRLSDYNEAIRLALQARDSIRKWRGDSIPAILVAARASVLANNLEFASRLLRVAPGGEALEYEANDRRLRAQTALMLANYEEHDDAEAIAEAIDDPFVSHMVAGKRAANEGRLASAENRLSQAWETAPDDASRIQAAYELAAFGLKVPDLTALDERYDTQKRRIETLQQIFSSDDPLLQLKLRENEFPDLTVLYAKELIDQGKPRKAAEVLEAGGNRWNLPLLLQMSAEKYAEIGEFQKSVAAASVALSLGGAKWAGRLNALRIRLHSLESQGKYEESLAITREMVTLSPTDNGVRWLLVGNLVRAGELQEAWQALTPEGTPIDPKSQTHARIWITLSAECDQSENFLSRALKVAKIWQNDPDVVGTFISEMYRAISRHDREVSEQDLHALHTIANQFSEEHPNSHIFRSVSIDEDDPLASLDSLLNNTVSISPEMVKLGKQISSGELPLGVASSLSRRPYTEVCLIGVGLTYSNHTSANSSEFLAAKNARDARVVVDSSAAVTLAKLSKPYSKHLVSTFFALETTDVVFRDALASEQNLRSQSTLSLHRDYETGQPYFVEVDPSESEKRHQTAVQVADLFAGFERRSWPIFGRISEIHGEPTWLNALDYALSTGLPFWCDDRNLRILASQRGCQTFGTLDLLAALKSENLIEEHHRKEIQAELINLRHVDLGFDSEVLRIAAEQTGWKPEGAAIALTRVSTWKDIESCSKFAFEAMSKSTTKSPQLVEGWTTATAVGLLRLASGNKELASKNLRTLLTRQFSESWLRPDTLPYVVSGIRRAMAELPGVTDPLPDVIPHLFKTVANKHNLTVATKYLLLMVENLDEQDRNATADFILTSSELDDS